MNVRKTEYDGTVYDSKSEAVFARALHLAGAQTIYHPPNHGGHQWDFLVFPGHTKWATRGTWLAGQPICTPEPDWLRVPTNPRPTLVEYKPSPPTWTYIDGLIEGQRNEERIHESVLVWGNPWAGVTGDHLHENCCYQVFPLFSSYPPCDYGWGAFNPMADSGSDLPVSLKHPIEAVFGIFQEHANRAKGYRFDLYRGGAA